MKREPVLEKVVVSRIMAVLKRVPGIVVRKRLGTVMGVAGDADLYGSYRGRHFEIEVKRPDDARSQLSQLQAQRLREWHIDGNALTGVARTADEALAILGIMEPVWICAGCGEYRWQGTDEPARCPRCGHTHFHTENA